MLETMNIHVGPDKVSAPAQLVNGSCRALLQAMPMWFARKAQPLVAISLEGSVG